MAAVIPLTIATPVKTRGINAQPDARWRFAWLMAAPHRLCFFTAAVMMATSSLWWAAVLVARAMGQGLNWAIPMTPAHALLMTTGFLPLFMAGFLFTAGPRWLALPEGSITTQALRGPICAMLIGWACAIAGFHMERLLAGAGLTLVAAGWSTLCIKFAGLLRRSPLTDRAHAQLAGCACGIGGVALWIAAAAVFTDQVPLLRSATQLALWCFIATVFAVVSHRMLPFFTAGVLPFLDAWRPAWLLWAIVGALWLSALLAIAELWWFPIPAALRGMQAAFEACMAGLLLWLALRWGLVQSFRNRLLAMLHGGFVWLGIAFALACVSHGLMALSGGERSLGLAPMHALTMGYFGATLLAMATRVSSGHGGRPLAADGPAWILYWILQTAVLLRVIAALWTEATPFLTIVAVLCWAVATVGWALRYGRWFGQPRSDGRPG